jgi:hypothetical protein
MPTSSALVPVAVPQGWLIRAPIKPSLLGLVVVEGMLVS